MFVGHYGPAAALAGDRIKLWHGFLAVQFLDILWAPFTMLGIEKFRIIENFTASNHIDLYHMPYTHSLPGALGWSVVAAILYRVIVNRKAGLTDAFVIGGLVFSHWLLDLPMHKPDMELWFGGPKVGFSLWDNRPLSVGIEFGLLIVGLGVYLARTSAKSIAGWIAPAVLFALMATAQLYGNYGPAPASTVEFAASGIAAYLGFALLAAWVDATRRVKS